LKKINLNIEVANTVMPGVTSQTKRHGRILALKCMHENEPYIYIQVGKLRLFYMNCEKNFF